MNHYIRQFEDQDVELVYDDVSKKVLFRLEDVARVAGFAKVGSLRYHTKEKVREVKLQDGIYLRVKSLNKIAKAANRTPGMTRFALWAKDVAVEITQLEEDKSKAVSQVIEKVASPILYTISGAATIIGMSVKELSDWLVDEGYANRYVSNGSIYFSHWFKEQGYGTFPKINDEKGTRTSRNPKLTKSGLEFVTSRIGFQRANNVLSFIKKESFDKNKAEQKELEAGIDNLIVQKFSAFRYIARYDSLLQPGKKEYIVDESQLIKSVKEILAEVKLKELQ